MKKLFLVLLAGISFNLNAQDSTNLSTDVQGRIKNIVLAEFSPYLDTTYTDHIEGFSHTTFKLRGDKTYEAHYGSGGCNWDDLGKWKIEAGHIVLMPTACDFNGEKDCSQSLGDGTVDLIISDSSLYYSEFIRVSSPNKIMVGDTYYMYTMIFGVPGKELRNEEKRKFEGVDVIAMGLKSGITTSDVKIRETPDAAGKIIKYWKEMGADDMDFVPKNETVEVIARTASKVKVQKWNNYWYLVNVGMHGQVWMYGEFVKFN